MVIKIEKFTGYEDSCEVIINDKNGKYLKTFFIDDLEYEMLLNQQSNRTVKITGYNCTQYNDLEAGVSYIPSNYELQLIQNEMKNLVDWEEWEERYNLDLDDLINNDLN